MSALDGTAMRRRLLTVAGLASLFLVGGAVGGSLLHNLPPSQLGLVLSFALAALLYLVTEELPVEAHPAPDSPLITATFFLGFLIFLILGVML